MSVYRKAVELASTDPGQAFDLLLGVKKAGDETAGVELTPEVDALIADLPDKARRLILVSKQDESRMMLVLGEVVQDLAQIVGSFPELTNEAKSLNVAALKVMRSRSKV